MYACNQKEGRESQDKLMQIEMQNAQSHSCDDIYYIYPSTTAMYILELIIPERPAHLNDIYTVTYTRDIRAPHIHLPTYPAVNWEKPNTVNKHSDQNTKPGLSYRHT